MKDIAIILGIRPDVIRASKILNILDNQNQISYDFIWSGQHYSENMKDTFFNQLNVKKPDFEFTVDKGTDASVVSSTIENLYSHFEQHKYKAAVFLGDTNTVMGCIAAAQHNIPIVHIEGCMRSYDWRMPEEKYRTVIDHLSDRIYTYLQNYKIQGMNEGISENIIKVTGNPIVDIINENIEYFESGSDYLEDDILDSIKEKFVLVTCHRRENILNEKSFKNIINLLNEIENHNVIFPNFVEPLETRQFNGTDIMMESGSAQGTLKGKNCYAFTHFRNRYPLGHVWMNLHKINSEEYAAVPVKPIKKFEEHFYKKYFIDRFKR